MRTDDATNYPVNYLQIETTIPLSDYYLFLGKPSHVTYAPIEGVTQVLAVWVRHSYFDDALVLSTLHPCPLNMREFLTVQRVVVRFAESNPTPVQRLPWWRLFREDIC
jgi:hypothetical protein